MIGPIGFGNADTTQAAQAPQTAPVQEQQPVAEQPLPQAPAQDTFTPEQTEQAAPAADPNDQFVKAEQPAEQK